MARIFTYIEHKDGVPDDSAFELATAARMIDRDCTADGHRHWTGARTSTLRAVRSALPMLRSGKSRMKHWLTPMLTWFDKRLLNVLPSNSIVLVPHDHFGIDLAPGLSIKMNSAFVSDVLDIAGVDGTHLKLVRQEFGGQVSAHVRCDISSGAVITMRPGAFKAVEIASEGNVIVDKSAEVDVLIAGRRYLETVVAEAGDVDITKHNILVSIGRGIQEKENVAIAEELADAMGARGELLKTGRRR